jgi:hypothetical protein
MAMHLPLKGIVIQTSKNALSMQYFSEKAKICHFNLPPERKKLNHKIKAAQ